MSPIVMFLQQAAAPAAGVADPGAAASPAGDLTGMLFMMVGMGAIFYFLIWRPQSQRAKQVKAMHAALKKGDQVITSGGIIGKITKMTDDEVTIDTGEGGKLLMTRSAIGGIYNRADPKPANDVKES
ncbi:MAG TPA: preprotein translocase subunit YajC [Hyphomonadaceae bacterium]|jgi:preprotein translocase subunit YajC|nr:preprotein translocase subunit YajC [Hyphomonadaceae bacterium]